MEAQIFRVPYPAIFIDITSLYGIYVIVVILVVSIFPFP